MSVCNTKASSFILQMSLQGMFKFQNTIPVKLNIKSIVITSNYFAFSQSYIIERRSNINIMRALYIIIHQITNVFK